MLHGSHYSASSWANRVPRLKTLSNPTRACIRGAFVDEKQSLVLECITRVIGAMLDCFILSGKDYNKVDVAPCC